MITVDQHGFIRRRHFIDGLSQRAIAKELGHSRKTVAKALQHLIPPAYQQREPRGKPVLDPVKPIIDGWLDQDRHRPAKQRHTAQRIYERLRDEHRFKGHPATVRRYVAAALASQQEVFMPLAFEPGEEAQVDWHAGWIIESGAWVKVQFFCMRLCYSKASFVWPYRTAGLESFLDGHVKAFEYFGRIPNRIAYDNLRSAVIQVKRGRERRLNERFKQLQSWYVFDTRFCNIARGNEKGDVENLAKRSERTYLTPVPEVTAFEQLPPLLQAGCERDLDRPGAAPHQDRTRRALFKEELACMRSLPEHRFEACVQHSTFIDKQSLVRVETNFYSAPVRWAHHPVTVKRFVDRIELVCEHQVVAAHERSYGRGQYTLTPAHYLPLLRIKPGSLDNARAFKGQPWGEDFELLRRELEYRDEGQGTRRYIEVLLLFTDYPEQDVKDAVALCVRRRAFAYEAVLAVLRGEPARPYAQLDLSDRPHLQLVGDGTRPLAQYNTLLDREEVVA